MILNSGAVTEELKSKGRGFEDIGSEVISHTLIAIA